ncbi:MAG: TetR/AcrR family transcriptional regulator [Myxococcales bacterium]|nr:TetR/AcrR family transcriptional regulator [Myxococcales bacterium]
MLGGRSEDVARRALEAAVSELAASGFSGLRMEAVAARAGVNKTTIYRRWPTRSALVAAVVERLRAPLRENPLPDTGTLEGDLIEAFERRFTVGQGTEGLAWARLLAERSNAEVDALIGDVVAERRGEWRQMVARALERAELPPATDGALVLDFVRAIVDAPGAGTPLDADRLRRAVQTVLAGARAGTLAPSSEPDTP